MKISLKPLAQKFQKTLEIPGSKSITNRALLLAALSEGPSVLKGMLHSDDTSTFANALRAMGVELNWQLASARCEVLGTGGKFPATNTKVWCRDAGTAARFLLPTCAQSAGTFHFDGSPRLRARPLSELLRVLKDQGARFTPADAQAMPFQVHGAPLKGGDCFIAADESSQFLSGLLIVAPLAQQSMKISTDEMVSKPYLAMTCQMMQDFGVMVEKQGEQVFIVPAPQIYRAREYQIEPDLSTASYFFGAAAMTASEITIPNIDRNNCLQGDVQFLTVLESMGCQVRQTAAGVMVQGPKQLSGITVDMNAFSDTFMTLACLAPFAEGPVVIQNIKHVRLQESDRLQATYENLQKLKINCELTEDSITIFPGTPQGCEIDPHHDHRLAMAFGMMSLRVPNITIQHAECVAKTCPNYFELLQRLLLRSE
jgi:3-phosphoshikimate 1-carboxyvinyltransferase